MNWREMLESGIAQVAAYKGESREDWMILKWYNSLVASGESEKVFEGPATPASILKLFQRPNFLFYAEEDDEIVAAFWLEPRGNLRAFCGAWMHEKKRNRKFTYHFFQVCYSIAFEQFTVLFGLTKQDDLLSLHEHIGYDIIGPVEMGWDGISDAYLMSFTKDRFKNSSLNPEKEE